MLNCRFFVLELNLFSNYAKDISEHFYKAGDIHLERLSGHAVTLSETKMRSFCSSS